MAKQTKQPKTTRRHHSSEYRAEALGLADRVGVAAAGNVRQRGLDVAGLGTALTIARPCLAPGLAPMAPPAQIDIGQPELADLLHAVSLTHTLCHSASMRSSVSLAGPVGFALLGKGLGPLDKIRAAVHGSDAVELLGHGLF